jgi:hypothetical protein
MSDALVLLAVLAAFYLYDCSLWLPRDVTVFLACGWSGWRPRRPSPLLSGGEKGLFLSFRWPPLAPVYLCPGRIPAGRLAAALDVGALEQDLARFTQCARLLRILCNALFVYLFAIVPVTVTWWSLTTLWPVLLSVLATLVVPIAVEYRDLHAWLWPGDAGERRSELAHMALYAPAAMRAHDRLAHRLCAPYHPLAVAALLCPPGVFRAFAARAVRQLHHPVALEQSQAYSPAEMSGVSRLLQRVGLTAADLLRPPPRPDASSQSYCPRCESAYAIAGGTCADCAGVVLVPYPRDCADGSASASGEGSP